MRSKEKLPGEFNSPSFIKVINDKVYVCDHGNNRFQILDAELEYVIVNSKVMEIVSLNTQVALNNCVQIFDCKGQFLSSFNKKGVATKFSSWHCYWCQSISVCM